MHLHTSMRWRRARARRAGAAVVLASLAGTGAALLATGPGTPLRTAAATAPCLPLLCPTPTPTQSHSTPPPTNQPPPPTSSHSSHPTPTPYQPPPTYPPNYVPPPGGTPLPILPPPSPGAPPQPPDLAVQNITLQVASPGPPKPGGQVMLQATLEAQRDTDTYAVPHATVTFTLAAQSGAGAFVDPAQADSGDTGVVLVTVQTGDQPGDTVVQAQAGNATAQISIHSDPSSSPTPTATPHHGVAVGATPGSNGSRRLLVASLAALLAAMVGGYAAALVLGRLPNPLQRRRVWGRRTR